ncbi:hypothetical protein AB0B15_17025 [Streptomyces sp. NPDC045456]|uniref:hypothetical protein n=1 Tax=unclassified Streptomyces TaxID=2593676 RepID=UPI00341101F8
MSDTTTTADGQNGSEDQDAGQGADGNELQDVSVEELRAEVARWKAMSRRNERSFKDAARERDQARQAAMSDQERAIEQARQEARAEAMSEAGKRLALAELRAQAAQAGAQLPDADFLNVDRFVSADGEADAEAVKAFIGALPGKEIPPRYRQDMGLGRQQSGKAGQLTRADLAGMSAKQINEARAGGRLDALMHGEI